jgi:hypothetical protein
MYRSRRIILFLSMSIVTAVPTYLYLFPRYSYVLQIWVERRSGIEMRRDKEVFISNGKGPIFYDIASADVNPSIQKVSLRVRSPIESDFEKPRDLSVSRGSFLGTVPLGSAENPITSDEDYTYEIHDAADPGGNSRLSEGSIHVKVKAVISDTSPSIMIMIGALGLLASLLQILEFFKQRRLRNQETTP